MRHYWQDEPTQIDSSLQFFIKFIWTWGTGVYTQWHTRENMFTFAIGKGWKVKVPRPEFPLRLIKVFLKSLQPCFWLSPFIKPADIFYTKTWWWFLIKNHHISDELWGQLWKRSGGGVI